MMCRYDFTFLKLLSYEFQEILIWSFISVPSMIARSKWAFEVNKMKLSKKTIILFTAVILVSAVMAVAVFGRPTSPGIGRERGHIQFIEPILTGHGFAMNGDQYHIIDVKAVKMSNPQNATSTVGYLRFAGQAYAINITGYDNRSFEGDVLTLPPHGTNRTSFTPSSVGYISLSKSRYEGELVSTGTLKMNGTEYKVLLTSHIKSGNWMEGKVNINPDQ